MDLWVKKKCIQCGTEFSVRRCYAKRGQGKFCSTSCVTTYRNLHNNPSKSPEVRAKISLNHADFSGKNNPMYGKRRDEAPSYIDGRSFISGDLWRRVALANKPPICEICGIWLDGRRLHVHHKDRDRSNNEIDNLQVVCVNCHNLIVHKHSRDANGRFIS